jgi:hypothetical protein
VAVSSPAGPLTRLPLASYVYCAVRLPFFGQAAGEVLTEDWTPGPGGRSLTVKMLIQGLTRPASFDYRTSERLTVPGRLGFFRFLSSRLIF